ncbi:MAG TPA: ABC transporter substrate-binding protein [Kiloniellales bacterium]
MSYDHNRFAIDRRSFLAGTAGAGLLLGLAPRAFAATPKAGGRLRLGLSGGSTSDSLDPATYASGGVLIGVWGFANNLGEIDETGDIAPELAESWEASDDAKTWTFKLRKGVEFHNGKALTADDVIASYNYHRDPDSKSGAKGILDSIVDIKANGNDAIVFELKDGNADFPFVTADYHLVIFPAKDGGIDWQSAIGTGGYKLDSYEPGVRMTLKRQPNYWKPDRAHFDEVEIIYISDSAARQNALITGEVDVIDRVELKTVHLLARREDVVVEEVTGTQHYTMPMFADVAPFSDNNVRLALKYAVDRERLVETILRGHGRVGNDSPITPANRFFDAGLEQRVYDPDKAKFHLKQAGLSSLKVDLSAADAAFVGAVDTAVLFKESAAKAGIDISVVREPDDGYWSNVWTVKPFVMCFWNGRPTEDWMFSLVYTSDAAWNDTHWKNERFDKLVAEARALLDQDKRREMYYELQSIVRDEGATIIPMYANAVDARSKKVAHGDKLASNAYLDGWKVVERWWSA